MKFTKKVKQEVGHKVFAALCELFQGKRISGAFNYPTATQDILIGYEKGENTIPDMWIDFIFTHEEIEERAYGLFEKTNQVGSVPVYMITVSTYYDIDQKDFYDTIYHELRHTWQRYNEYEMSEQDAEGYAEIMTAQNS